MAPMVIMAVVAVVSAAASAAASLHAAKQQEKIGEYNAKISENNAISVRQQATFEADKQRENTRKLLAIQRAGFAKSGVGLGGSPLLVMEQTARDAELDAQTIEYGGEVKAAGYQSSAGLSLMESSAAASASRWKAGTTLLSGAAKAYGSLGGGVSDQAPSIPWDPNELRQ